MMESEGVTENTDPWRTEVPAKFVSALGLEHVMFEAADPEVFQWYVKNLWAGGESLRGPQPDSRARGVTEWYLGNEESLGKSSDVQGGMKKS